jgi:hypothetical protein
MSLPVHSYAYEAFVDAWNVACTSNVVESLVAWRRSKLLHCVDPRKVFGFDDDGKFVEPHLMCGEVCGKTISSAAAHGPYDPSLDPIRELNGVPAVENVRFDNIPTTKRKWCISCMLACEEARAACVALCVFWLSIPVDVALKAMTPVGATKESALCWNEDYYNCQPVRFLDGVPVTVSQRDYYVQTAAGAKMVKFVTDAAGNAIAGITNDEGVFVPLRSSYPAM